MKSGIMISKYESAVAFSSSNYFAFKIWFTKRKSVNTVLPLIFYLKFPHPCLVIDLKQKNKENPTLPQKREKHGFLHDKYSIMPS